jgi:hypothetical protein
MAAQELRKLERKMMLRQKNFDFTDGGTNKGKQSYMVVRLINFLVHNLFITPFKKSPNDCI